MQYIVNTFSFNPLKTGCLFITDVIVQQLKNNPGNIVEGIKTCLFRQQTELHHICQVSLRLTQTDLHINDELQEWRDGPLFMGMTGPEKKSNQAMKNICSELTGYKRPGSEKYMPFFMKA